MAGAEIVQKNRPTNRKEKRARSLSCTIFWQRGGGAKLDSAVAALGLAARLHSTASSGHGRASRHQRRAATARRRGGDEDTGGDSNCRGTNNQQSTKGTDTTTMTATLITIETKGTAVAAEAR
jgi:hypothetical protein